MGRRTELLDLVSRVAWEEFTTDGKYEKDYKALRGV